MKTSYSALETYKQCPQKYKFSKIDKIREPKRIESVFGTMIHSALKFAFERNPLYPTEDEVINFFTEKWQEKSEFIEWSDQAKREAGEKLYFGEGVRILKNFLKKNKPWTFNAVSLEGRFSLELEDEITNETHSLSGIIDRIDKDPESELYEIIDYKTGKSMPGEEALQDNLQLGVYHLALTTKWPSMDSKNIKTSLYFLKHNEKVSATLSDEARARTKARILETIREIEKSEKTGNFPPHPGPLCNYCGFRKICPMWSHEYKKETQGDATEEELSEALKEFFEIKESDEKNKKRMAEIRKLILRYMSDKNVERVFGHGGFITRTTMARYSFDMDKIQPMLARLKKWDDILAPDNKKLEKLIQTLPSDIRGALLSEREKKETIMLKGTKK